MQAIWPDRAAPGGGVSDLRTGTRASAGQHQGGRHQLPRWASGTGKVSGEWQKANDHLKSLITEPYITIERKGIEPKTIKDFAGYMVLSNHDAPLRVEMDDGCIVCLDVSS